MNLTIDIGNTCVKLIVFDDTVPVFRKAIYPLSDSLIRKLLKNYPIENCMLSSVINVSKSMQNSLKKVRHFERLTSSTSIPIKNLYKTPKTLGSDRLANVVAASFLFPGENSLVIDLGTCIKYDFINSKAQYLGGSIAPGMEMRFKALNHFTGKLPLIKKSDVKKLTGQSTTEALQTGVVIGMQEEIKGFIQLYKKKYKSLRVILTGGDAFRFAKNLNLSIFAAADLVNIGLNEIIRFNENKA